MSVGPFTRTSVRLLILVQHILTSFIVKLQYQGSFTSEYVPQVDFLDLKVGEIQKEKYHNFLKMSPGHTWGFAHFNPQ